MKLRVTLLSLLVVATMGTVSVNALAQEVTERATDPSGAMGAIQRTMANDVACRHTLRDFALKPAERRLFPGITDIWQPLQCAPMQAD